MAKAAQVNIFVDESIRDKLKEDAKKDHRSVSGFVRAKILGYYEK